MSRLIAKVSKIESCDNLHIVKFEFKDAILTMMSLELSDTIKVGAMVVLVVKPTHIGLAKGVVGNLSYSNQLSCQINSIQNGKLLSNITLKLEDDILLESIITKDSAYRLGLKETDEVTVIIKASDISISEVVDV